ncbi:MAG: hypothetical protein JHC76_06605 [Akkermansiaceae bacterium]|nr:hypothetical protein [Akkermansiaceae bacterium]
MALLDEIRWRPTIGDPTIMGWITVAAYALCALLMLAVWYRKREQKWLWFTLSMALLCVNKQLDLQSLFTDLGRIAAYHQHWYEQRRDFQKWFVLAVLLVAISVGGWFIIRHLNSCRNNKILTLGFLFLLTFILIRAISFHHFDLFLKDQFLRVKMNWLLELSGIFLITLGAVMNLTKYWKRAK